MKTIKITVTLLLFVIISGFGQENESDINLRPLSECIDLAIINSPEIKLANSQIKTSKADFKMNSSSWLGDGLSVGGRAEYIYRDKVDFDPSQDIINSSFFGHQMFFSAGLTLAIPTSSPKIKKWTKKSYESIIEQQKYNREVVELTIKNEVVTLYTGLNTASNIMNQKSQVVQDMNLSLEDAKIRYEQEEINIKELTDVRTAYTSAVTEFELARLNFEDLYYRLQFRVGEDIEIE